MVFTHGGSFKIIKGILYTFRGEYSVNIILPSFLKRSTLKENNLGANSFLLR